MDALVKRAMAKWPNVPNVFGWLRLDCRGEWLLCTSPGVYDRIRNPAIVEFIGRNYEHDERGRWYFQNGPQRVFVALDCAPYVFRLDERREAWLAHTGAPAGALSELLLDDEDALILVTERGPGVVLDRDLAFVLDNLCDERGAPLDAEELMAKARPVENARVENTPAEADTPRMVHIAGGAVRFGRVARASLAARYGFVPSPQPEGGTDESSDGLEPKINEPRAGGLNTSEKERQ